MRTNEKLTKYREKGNISRGLLSSMLRSTGGYYGKIGEILYEGLFATCKYCKPTRKKERWTKEGGWHKLVRLVILHFETVCLPGRSITLFFESANEEPQWPMQILASRHKFPKLNETCRECNAESRTISASSLSAGKRGSGSGGIKRQNRKSERERRLNMEYENYFFFQLPIQAHLGASIERCQCILIYLGSSYLSQHRLVVAYVIAWLR